MHAASKKSKTYLVESTSQQTTAPDEMNNIHVNYILSTVYNIYIIYNIYTVFVVNTLWIYLHVVDLQYLQTACCVCWSTETTKCFKFTD